MKRNKHGGKLGGEDIHLDDDGDDKQDEHDVTASSNSSTSETTVSATLLFLSCVAAFYLGSWAGRMVHAQPPARPLSPSSRPDYGFVPSSESALAAAASLNGPTDTELGMLALDVPADAPESESRHFVVKLWQTCMRLDQLETPRGNAYAERFCRRASELSRDAFVLSHVYNSLSLVLAKQGRFHEAVAVERLALAEIEPFSSDCEQHLDACRLRFQENVALGNLFVVQGHMELIMSETRSRMRVASSSSSSAAAAAAAAAAAPAAAAAAPVAAATAAARTASSADGGERRPKKPRNEGDKKHDDGKLLSPALLKRCRRHQGCKSSMKAARESLDLMSELCKPKAGATDNEINRQKDLSETTLCRRGAHGILSDDRGRQSADLEAIPMIHAAASFVKAIKLMRDALVYYKGSQEAIEAAILSQRRTATKPAKAKAATEAARQAAAEGFAVEDLEQYIALLDDVVAQIRSATSAGTAGGMTDDAMDAALVGFGASES